jgi:xylulose-5-phosphate/fructose-6-phosphate phosphoketolase
VLNEMSRYHLCIAALQRAPRLHNRAAALIDECRDLIVKAVVYAYEHFEDPPEIRDWTWTAPAAGTSDSGPPSRN